MSLTGKPSLTNASPITNDGFWPDVAMGDLMSKYRIPSEYADDTIQWGLSLAVVRVNEHLERIKQLILSDAVETFEDYLQANSSPIFNRELMHVQYEHAVFSRAKALLLKQFVTMNRRQIAENEAKESEQTEMYWLDQSQASVASLMKAFFPDEDFMRKSNLHVALL